MKFSSTKQLKVSLSFDAKDILVGRLAINDGQIYFEYDNSFLNLKLEISPHKLPLQRGLVKFDRNIFEGLGGVFYDALPDGWGRLLADRTIRSKGILPEELSPLDRLSLVGKTGMGALIFEPDSSAYEDIPSLNLDDLAADMALVLAGESSEVLDELLNLNGSSAGARPKAMIQTNKDFSLIAHNGNLNEGFEHWIVKFPNSYDGLDAGAIEYVYSIMAKNAGVEMMQTHLFKAKKGSGYFATKRFDRIINSRLHTHTAAGLLHSDFRAPCLDYQDLIALTGFLTKDQREVEKMFRLAVFNVYASNKDDHGKNFTFLMNKSGNWRLAPAYDLTFSGGLNGEQSTMVMGEGRSITIQHLEKLAEEANINKKHFKGIIDQTKESLKKWPTLAKEHGVSKSNIELIRKAYEKNF